MSGTVYLYGIGVEDLGSGSVYHKIKGRTNLQKGGHAGLLEKHGEWLGSSTGPHTKEVWTGKIARLCNKALISYG